MRGGGICNDNISEGLELPHIIEAAGLGLQDYMYLCDVRVCGT